MTRRVTTAFIAFALAASAGAQGDLPELHEPLTLGSADETPENSGAPAYPLLPEGTYLTDRLIRVVPVGSRATAAVFLRGEDDAPLRPMALLPCSNTQAIEQIALSGDSDVFFEVSGQVFSSRGLNYFLPLIVRVVTPEDDEPIEEPDASTEAPPSDTPPPPVLADRLPEDDISVEELIKELDAATIPTGVKRTGDDGRPLALTREGGVVTLRRGRIDRAASGAPIFTFDIGIDPENPEVDPPMGLLPCTLTDEMERVAARRGEHVTFTVSGRVFLYDESNYLLPTMFFVNRAGEGGLSSAH